MPSMPRAERLDGSLALLREGYAFIARRCDRLDSDVFRTRLLLQDAICMRGEAAAELFYDEERFVRAGAAPEPLRKTLLGEGGVQGLDDERHRNRKAMFMRLMTPEAIERLVGLTRQEWRRAADRWAEQDEVVLFEETMPLLCRAVCEWAGVPLAEDEVRTRTEQMAAMIDGPASVGARHLRGRVARRRGNRWAGRLVARVRSGDLAPPEDTALARIARHRDVDGELLTPHTAAVELVNVVRPTVAVARFVAFAALALHLHPEVRARLAAGNGGDLRHFVHEVRRFYPFFPMAAARVRTTFTWRGYTFPRGTRTLLDLYGTDHDPRLWDEPERFLPARFDGREPGPFAFIPQGGGDHLLGHRCAGEWLTIALVQEAVRVLTSELAYEVPDQDLSIDLSRMPAIPRSRFVLRDVRWIGPTGGPASASSR